MNFYNVSLPAVSNEAQQLQPHYSVCQVSVSLLRDLSSWLLTRHVPVDVVVLCQRCCLDQKNFTPINVYCV